MPRRRGTKRKATSQRPEEEERRTRSQARAVRRLTLGDDGEEAGPSNQVIDVPAAAGSSMSDAPACSGDAAAATPGSSAGTATNVTNGPSVANLLRGTSGGSNIINVDHNNIVNVQDSGVFDTNCSSSRPSVSVVNVTAPHSDARPINSISSNIGVGLSHNLMNGGSSVVVSQGPIYTGNVGNTLSGLTSSIPNQSNVQMLSSGNSSSAPAMPLTTNLVNVNNQASYASGTSIGGIQSMNVIGTQPLIGYSGAQQGSILSGIPNAIGVNTLQLGGSVSAMPVSINNQSSASVIDGSTGGMQSINVGGSQIANGSGLAQHGLVPSQFNPHMMNTIATNSITTPGSVPMMNPLVSVCSPLSACIPQALKTKIINSEFVDFGLLLEKNEKGGQEQKDFSLTVGEGGKLLWHNNKPKREVNSIYTWTTAFLIYSSVYLSAHPQRAQEMLKYAHIVRTAASRHEGWGWRVYDIQYRMRQQWNPLRSWALIDGELWTLYVSSSPVRANFTQAQGGIGQSKTRKEGFMSSAQTFRAFNQKKGRESMSATEFRKAVSGKLCFDFNSAGCSRQKCKFMHKCSKCNGINHGAQKCTKGANK